MQKVKQNYPVIKEISIENLKTFVSQQKLNIAPITLLYGENSSGKTTVLKAFDIILSIFGHDMTRPVTDIGKNIYESDIKKNLSPERINILSSFGDNKPIKIKFKIDLKLPMSLGNSMLLDKKNLKEKTLYYETLIAPKKISEAIDFSRKRSYKKEINLCEEIEVSLDIKFFKNNKNSIENTSKVDKIKINYKDETFITYKRVNKNYHYIENENITGFINPKEREKYLKNYIKEQDFFTSSKGYSDYIVDIDQNSQIIKRTFEVYKQILNGDKNRLRKIKRIISFYNDYFKTKYLYEINQKFEDVELKKLKIFECVAKIILSNEDYDIEDIKRLDHFDIDQMNNFLNKKLLANINKKSIFLLANLLSNIKNHDINNLEILLAKENNKENFSKILIESFKEYRLRFTRSSYSINMFPKAIIEKNKENIKVYDEEFEKSNNFTLPGVQLLSSIIFHLNHFIKQEFKNNCLSKNQTWRGYKFPRQELDGICKSPHSVINQCIHSILEVSDNIQSTSPNSTEETFSIFTLNDLNKSEKLTLMKQFTMANNLDQEDVKKNKELLLKAAKDFKKEKIAEKYNKPEEEIIDHETGEYKDDELDIFYDPTEFSRQKKNISELGPAGEYFNNIIINNNKQRKRLNKILKQFFDLEIILVNLKYFDKFSKSDQKAVRQVMRESNFEFRSINDKFIMIRDFKFKKKFNIHGVEIGKGPSNIFPFLLQILDERPNLTFAIQELENNWHPKYHSKLIMVLIEIFKISNNKNYILETHSELFILQIQKLVQKGILKPSDISVNYISRSKNGHSQITNIPLNSNGGFEKKWPGGFFTERMEILKS